MTASSPSFSPHRQSALDSLQAGLSQRGHSCGQLVQLQYDCLKQEGKRGNSGIVLNI